MLRKQSCLLWAGFLVGLFILTPDSARACKLFGFIGKKTPPGVLARELTAFAPTQGGAENSWAFGWFIAGDTTPATPARPRLFRAFGPAFSQGKETPRYTLEKAALEIERPRVVVGHLRVPSSGSVDLPDPHPFHKFSWLKQQDWLFAHNGTIPVGGLLRLVDQEYFESGHTGPTIGTDPNSYIDSELYAIFVVQSIDRATCPELGIWRAINTLDPITDDSLNFILSEGTQLYAVRYPGTTGYLLHIQDPPGGAYRAVSTRALDDSFHLLEGGAHKGTLAVLRPGRKTVLIPLGPGSREPVCTGGAGTEALN